MYRRIILIGLLGLAFANQSLGQARLQPGDPIIHMERLKPGHDFYRNVITDSTGKLLYDFIMEDACTIDPITKHIIFARTRQVPPGNFSADTSVTDLSLRPISMHEVHQTRKVSYDMHFDPLKATVTTNRNGTVGTKTYPMEAGYFEDNMIEYIWGCLDLKKGETYRLDNFNPATSGNDPYTLRYAFDDTWVLGAGVRMDLTVLYFTHGAVSGYIWIDKATHQILKAIGHSKAMTYVMTKQ